MERALKTLSLARLGALPRSAVRRVYWGCEFCEHLFPALRQTARALKLARDRGLDFSLLTPSVSGSGLAAVEETLAFLRTAAPGSEVIVNDWGVFHRLKSEGGGLIPVIGRVLARQHRDPAIDVALCRRAPEIVRDGAGAFRVVLPSPLAPAQRRGFMGSMANGAVVTAFLKKNGVIRIEFSSTIQGVNHKHIALKKTLYTPCVNVATTRYCPLKKNAPACVGKCLRRNPEVLRAPGLPRALYWKGNTVFYKNAVCATAAARAGFDRMVLCADKDAWL